MSNKEHALTRHLFLGEIHDELAFPYPQIDPAEQQHVDRLIEDARAFLAEHYDARRAEAEGWVGDDILTGLAERGLLGLYVPEEYGGQGLSRTGYCRVFEALAGMAPTLAVVMGVHQSIGMRGIYRFGTDEQKKRFLPDLVAGRKLAGFAVTEPNAGSDAYNVESRAVQQPDGSWKLNGEKRWIGNGSKDVIVTLARDGKDGHVLLILEKGMPGFEVGHRYDTLGLRANDLRHLYFKDVEVPPENLLGEAGEGYDMAMQILTDGRISLAAGCVGGGRVLLDLAMAHVQKREQFGKPLAEFELVKQKIAWFTSEVYGLESLTYLITGMADAGLEDYALESAAAKVDGTEFLWYAVNRAFQLAGGEAYMADQPYEKILRDSRVYPIFEGANDVLRLYVALTGLSELGDELEDLRDLNLRNPIRGLGAVTDYVGDRVRMRLWPDRLDKVHPSLKSLADPVSGQVKKLRSVSERLLRRHGKGVIEHQAQLARLAEVTSGVLAEIAVLSRLTLSIETSPDRAEAERPAAELFLLRTRRRIEEEFKRLEDNEDDAVQVVAEATYARGAYGLSFLDAPSE